jgi:hypothetical protein
LFGEKSSENSCFDSFILEKVLNLIAP